MGIVLLAFALVALAALVGAFLLRDRIMLAYGEWADQRAWNRELDEWSARHATDENGVCTNPQCTFGKVSPARVETSALVAQDTIVLLGDGFVEGDFEDDMIGGNDVDPLMVRFGSPLTDQEVEVLREFGY